MNKHIALAVVVAALALLATMDQQADAGGFRVVVGGGYGGHWLGGGPLHARHNVRFSPWGHARWHDTTHFDWRPAGVVRHYDHFDFIPGGWELHETGHWDHHRW